MKNNKNEKKIQEGILKNRELNIEYKNKKTRIKKITWIFQDTFHTIIYMKWRWVFLLIFLEEAISILIFSLLYYSDIKCLRNDLDMENFSQCFYLSVQTNYHIGFGDLHPGNCTWANIIVTFQVCLGILFDGIIFALIFEKFAKGSSRFHTILWSNYAVISKASNGVSTLSARVVDIRKNPLVFCSAKIFFVTQKSARNKLTEKTQLEFEMDTHDSLVSKSSDEHLHSDRKKTVKNYSRFFSKDELFNFSIVELPTKGADFSWQFSTIPSIISHQIDSSSPLFNKSMRNLIENNSEVVVIMEGFDALTSSLFRTKKYYSPNFILWNYEFDEIVSRDFLKGKVRIDLEKFNQVSRIGNEEKDDLEESQEDERNFN